MPEAEVEQQVPAVTEEATKEKEILQEESTKKSDSEDKGEEKKDKEKKDEKKEKPKKEVKEAAPPPPHVHKKDFEKDTVYLYQFPRCKQVPNVSPKCLKVETWLKLNGIKYENIDHNAKIRSKRGKLPFVEVNGEEISSDPDSIVKSLSKTYGKEMDESLNSEQKYIQHAMLTMVDNHLHGSFMYWASMNAENMLRGYKLNLQQMMGCNKVPNGILSFLFKYGHCRKGLQKAKANGFSGFTPEEIDEEGKKDLQALKEMLGDKQFFFGDDPHTLDLDTFCQLAQIINVDQDVKCPLRDFLNEECTNLVGLYNRMKDRAWGDHWDLAIGDKMELNPHIPKPDPPKEEEKKEDEAEEKEEKKEGDHKKEEDKEKGDNDEKEKEEKKEDEKKE